MSCCELWYGMHEKTDSEWFVLRKKYARLYDSYKIFNTDAQLGLDDLAPKQEQMPKARRQTSAAQSIEPEPVKLPQSPQRWKPELIRVSDDDIPMPETTN